MKAYHFLRRDMRAAEGGEPPWTVGETRRIEGHLDLCQRGYHSSPSWLDAVSYASGPVACIVDVSEPEGADDNFPRKRVSRTRMLLAARDVSRELRLFACDCAERALAHERAAGREPDARSWQAVAVARKHAMGEATDEQLAAVRAAAWRHAGDAVWVAAEATRARTWDAAWAAAEDAAWVAAEATRARTWDAAWAAAEDAAWVAAGDAGDAGREAERAWPPDTSSSPFGHSDIGHSDKSGQRSRVPGGPTTFRRISGYRQSSYGWLAGVAGAAGGAPVYGVRGAGAVGVDGARLGVPGLPAAPAGRPGAGITVRNAPVIGENGGMFDR